MAKIARKPARKSSRPAAARVDVYDAITTRIIEAIEAGTRPWVIGWTKTGGLQLRSCGTEYRGINQMLLGMAAASAGYTSPFWVTYNQAQADGLQVRRGEKATPVIYMAKILVDEDKERPEAGKREVFIAKSYSVFNLDQCDGERPARYYRHAPAKLDPSARLVDAEAALLSCGATVRNGGDSAHYSPSGDHVQMPLYSVFSSPSAYVATLAHELVHWTGHPSREARQFGKRFGDDAYAFEELVAELGAAMACARLGTAGEHIDNHAAYVASWLRVMRGDKRAIVKAGSLAAAAVDRILAGATVDSDELTADELEHA